MSAATCGGAARPPFPEVVILVVLGAVGTAHHICARARRKTRIDSPADLDYIPIHLIPLRGVSWDAWRCGMGVAPAGGRWTSPRALGTLWVAVRPHYGGLPLVSWLDAAQVNGGKSAGISGSKGSRLCPEARSWSDKSPRWSVEWRSRGLWFSTLRGSRCGPLPKARRSALRLPHREACWTHQSRKAVCGQRHRATGRARRCRHQPKDRSHGRDRAALIPA